LSDFPLKLNLMFFSRNRRTRQAASEYATRSDFQRIFSEDMAGLHLLAYLLTADRERAEEIFVAGLEDAVNGNPVFRQWARSWSQRAIIKRAIKAVMPIRVDPGVPLSLDPQTGRPELDQLLRAVAQLTTFQRFVFVLTVLEAYSITECSTLLASMASDVIAARAEALKQVAAQFEASLQIALPAWKSLFKAARAS
jgi:DNA-directed RNA polymerase specialized sigma24 family protein